MGLRELLAPDRPTQIVDVGANPIDGESPYQALLASGGCELIGFEPQREAWEALQARRGPHERYLPYALGDGRTHTLYVCRASGMTSLLPPDQRTLALFDYLRQAAEVTRTETVQTYRLDDVSEIEALDYLKIDVQGSELMIVKNGEHKLSGAVAVHTEVSFVTLYKGQPPFGALDLELRRQGFMPHALYALKRWPIAPCVVDGDPQRALNQLLEADVVYVRDVTRSETMSNEQLKHLAIIAHGIYRSFDLALRCVALLEDRHALPAGAQRAYLAMITAAV